MVGRQVKPENCASQLRFRVESIDTSTFRLAKSPFSSLAESRPRGLRDSMKMSGYDENNRLFAGESIFKPRGYFEMGATATKNGGRN